VVAGRRERACVFVRVCVSIGVSKRRCLCASVHAPVCVFVYVWAYVALYMFACVLCGCFCVRF